MGVHLHESSGVYDFVFIRLGAERERGDQTSNRGFVVHKGEGLVERDRLCGDKGLIGEGFVERRNAVGV